MGAILTLSLSHQVDPKSTRLQLLSPFKAWHGDDIKDAAILIKVRKKNERRTDGID